jgi:hypothetical protein
MFHRVVASSVAAAVILVGALLNCPLHAELPLKPENHTSNGFDDDEYGYCQWSSWEALGNALSYPELKELQKQRRKFDAGGSVTYTYGPLRQVGPNTWARERGMTFHKNSPGPANVYDVRDFLGKMGLPIVVREETPDVVFLQKSCDAGCGAVVSVFNYPSPMARHALLVVDCGHEKRAGFNAVSGEAYESDYGVVFFDCNHPGCTYSVDYTWFATVWTGKATTLPPGYVAARKVTSSNFSSKSWAVAAK